MADNSFTDRFLSDNCPQLHGHTRKALVACAGSVMGGAKLISSSIGRGLEGEARTKSKIKRVDRFLGNERLHADIGAVYQCMASAMLSARVQPVILVDWSSFEHGNQWALLRASLAVDGRSLTLLEHVHPIKAYNSPKAHEAFLDELSVLLGAERTPIIVTDAGFLGPWFRSVRARGWDFIGRLRGLTQVQLGGDEKWLPVKALYAKASKRARTLGCARCAKSDPYQAYLHIVEETARSRRLAGAAKHGYDEPWLLVTSLEPSHHRARQIVNIYAKRMQIELSFRDLKDDRWSFARVNARPTTRERRQVPLLIAAIATFTLWLIGLVAQTLQWQRHFQANTESKRRVLSLFFLGREVYRNPRYHIDQAMMETELSLLPLIVVDPRQCHAK